MQCPRAIKQMKSRIPEDESGSSIPSIFGKISAGNDRNLAERTGSRFRLSVTSQHCQTWNLNSIIQLSVYLFEYSPPSTWKNVLMTDNKLWLLFSGSFSVRLVGIIGSF